MSSLPLDPAKYRKHGAGNFCLDRQYGYDLRTISAYSTEELIEELQKRRLSDADD